MGSVMSMEFNAEQRAAITSEARNLLVLAGAGTGKTRTIIGRVAHLVAQGIDPERIVIVTFTRRAAGELRARLKTAAGAAATKALAGTFHHLCLRIMSSRRRWFGFDDLTVMDRDDQVHLMRLVRGELIAKDSNVPQASQLISYYSYARNTNQPAEDYLRKFTDLDGDTSGKVLELFAAYKLRKQVGAYLDYDDILHRFAKVLRDDTDVRRKVCSRYDHVLVDEMQDTNPLQWLILESFAEYCHLFCVGDDAQSIYAFRGADFRNVHSFEQRVSDSQTTRLQQNYRSTQPILDVANWLLAGSPLKYKKSLQSIRGPGPRPRFIEFNTDLEEANWVAKSILGRHAQGTDWSENMILCRTAYSARPIEAELIAQKIPYRFIGGMGLLQMAHVRDLLALLRIMVNHRDELAWARYLTLWPRIGEATAARLIEKLLAQTDLQSAMKVLEESLAGRPDVWEPPQALMQLSERPAQAIEVARTALEPLLEAKYDNWEARVRDLVLLERLATSHRTLRGFLETYILDPVSASEAMSQSGPDEGLVTLITVHSAKGTECEVCFIPAAQAGNYPHVRSLSNQDEIEEERRVLYVAMTRAKDELILSRHLRRSYGRGSWNAAAETHYFLREVPAQLVDLRPCFERPYDYLRDDVIS